MAEFEKPIFTSVWASAGAKVSMSDATINIGFTATKPSYQKFNALEFRQDAFCAHVNQHGIAVWDENTAYLADKSWVTGSDGEVYRAVSNSTGVNPVGDTSNRWYKPLDQFYTKSQVDSAIVAAQVPTGAVFHFAMQTAPAGFLVCNGAAVSRTAFAALFALIGTTYGVGNGTSTFNLPDLRGEFIRGADLGRGVDVGRVFGSSQGSQNLSHQHYGETEDAGLHTHTINEGSSNPQVGGLLTSGDDYTATAYSAQTTSTAGSHRHNFTTSLEGGVEARPRNIALLPCIKV